MKKRHGIMLIILVIFAGVLLNLKEEKKIKRLTCTEDGEFLNMQSSTTLKIGVKAKEIQSMKITIDAILSEEYKNRKQELIDYANESGKMRAISTKEGIRFETGIQSDYFKSLGLNTKTSYSELKKALELQGFTCK